MMPGLVIQVRPFFSMIKGEIGSRLVFQCLGGAVDGLYQDYEDDDQVASRFAEALEMPVYDANLLYWKAEQFIVTVKEPFLWLKVVCLVLVVILILTKEEIEKTLLESLGAEKVIWLPYGIYQDETNEHVDNVAAFVGPAELVLAWRTMKVILSMPCQ